MTGVQAIKAFFESGGARKVTMDEFKALSKEERAYLAGECSKVLGVTLDAPTDDKSA